MKPAQIIVSLIVGLVLGLVAASFLARERARIAGHIGDLRVVAAKAGAVVQPERRDPAGPRVKLLEEVVGAAARLAPVGPEPDLVGADVEHRRRGGRANLVEKEPELPSARAKRDGVHEPHPGEGTGQGGAPPGEIRSRT